MSDSPFGQPQDSNQNPFEPQFGGMFMQEETPPKRNKTLRNCLIIMGVVFVCIAFVCICFVAVLYQAREVVPATFWVLLAGSDSLDNASTMNVVCAGSQAERFTENFQTRYPGPISIEINNSGTTYDSDNNQVTLKGTMTSGGESQPYEAIFTIDTEGDDFMYLFGCISQIDQVSPPLTSQ